MNETLIKEILDGLYDSELETIVKTVNMRRENLNDKKLLSVRRGDIVEFNFATRPKYLQGLHAEVIRTNRTTVSVKVIEDHKSLARRYGFGTFRCPISLVEKV